MNPNCCSTQEIQKASTAPAGADQIARAVPAVDVIESEDGVTLWADMPGVTRETLEITVEKGLLTLSGRVERAAAGATLHDENTTTDYLRRFQIGEELDESKITAELKDGSLKLHLPKAERARPRRIEIKAQ